MRPWARTRGIQIVIEMRNTRNRFPAAAALVAILFLAPAPAQSQGPATAASVDASRLMADLSVLAADSMEGRRVGTPGSARARSYLLRRFEEIGIAPFGDSLSHPFEVSSRNAQAQTGVNVLGVIRGSRTPDRYIVVSAHYDHLGVRNGEIFNGADDNASGTAAILAVAAYFKANAPAHSLIIAAFDAEEGGLRGARAFLAEPPVPVDAIVMDVNLDMVARGDNGELWVTGTYQNPQLLPLIDSIARTAPVTLRPGHDSPEYSGSDNWTNASDHGPFNSAGIPFLYFGVEDHPDYHRPTDDFEKVDADFYTRSVNTILSALIALDASPPTR